MNPENPPLGKIALGLSGGGFRAAAFHLGTLDVLHAAGLLQDVAAISTVSGGTFVGAAYALAAARGEAFSSFYPRFYRQLQERPLDRALASLRVEPVRLPAATLIAAHADAYDTIFFNGARFGEILNANSPSHLDEIAFNATDFAAGLPFRFQFSRRHRIRIGNGRHSIPRPSACDLRLADVVAASSCFPGGFEPMRLPEDFRGAESPEIADPCSQRQTWKIPYSIPLMDGGVADNQGLNSLLSAVGRIDRAESPRERIGLIIVSDVDRPAGGPLLQPNVLQARGGMRVRHVLLLARWLFLLALFTLAGAGWQLYRAATGGDTDRLRDALWLLLPILLALATLAGLAGLRTLLRRGFAGLPEVLERVRPDAAAFLQQLRVLHLADLLQMRARSLLVMSSSVFMKNVRDLRYKLLFSGKRYRDRAVSNLIYELADGHRRRTADLPPWLEPSPEIRRMAAAAMNMPTILWFQNAEQLPCVVACGRHTACYNLLRHLLLRYGPELEGADVKTREAFDRARQLWQRFQSDPLLATAAPLETHTAATSTPTRSSRG